MRSLNRLNWLQVTALALVACAVIAGFLWLAITHPLVLQDG